MFTGHTIPPLAKPDAFKRDQAGSLPRYVYGGGGKIIMILEIAAGPDGSTPELKLGTLVLECTTLLGTLN
jgi:hypothetical protein